MTHEEYSILVEIIVDLHELRSEILKQSSPSIVERLKDDIILSDAIARIHSKYNIKSEDVVKVLEERFKSSPTP